MSRNPANENSEKYDDWLLPWLIQAAFVLANLQLFTIDMCENDAIRLNGHIIKYIDSIHLINSVRSGSLAKLLKIMWLTLGKAECFFIFQNKVTSSLSFKGGTIKRITVKWSIWNLATIFLVLRIYIYRTHGLG